MGTLSDVSVLLGQNAGDLEMARRVFTTETRRFVEGVLEALTRGGAEKWMTPRLRIDLPADIETEAKSTVGLTAQHATAVAKLRYKKGTKFMHVGDVSFGILYTDADPRMAFFNWQVKLVPGAKYNRLDNAAWAHWQAKWKGDLPQGAGHHARDNTVWFVSRPLNKELRSETAFEDVKCVLDELLATEAEIGHSVGVEEEENE